MPFFNQLFAVRGFLIQETKPKLLKAISAIAPGIERKIPSLQGGGDPFSYVSDELELVEDNLKRAIRSREQILTDIAAHLIYGAGKRVRQVVTRLAFLASGGKRTKDTVHIAPAVDWIHGA